MPDSMPVADLPDPRVWPDPADAGAASAQLHVAVAEAIEAGTGREAAIADARALQQIERLLAAHAGRALADAFATAPSFAVARHLWRLLAAVERGEPQRTTALTTTLFALPVVLVAALDAGDEALTLSGILPDPRALEALLRDASEFAGAQAFVLSPALAAVDAIDLPALPGLLARTTLSETAAGVLPPLDLPPAPIAVEPGGERVHLRFIAGAVLTAPRADPLRATAIGTWGLPFAQAISRQLHAAGLSVLALPRPPARLVPAAHAGRAAQREVAARVFASNAIRKLRASVGEPTAVISAHRAADAPGGGELRLSLSSPFAPRDAEGFRCPLYPYEPVHDVIAMLAAMLRDCRVDNVGFRAGLHGDVDPLTGAPLLFKEATARPSAPLH